MDIVVVGISHKKAPIEVREKVSFGKDDMARNYDILKNHPEISEAFILSTCNRVELYGTGPSADAAIRRLKGFLSGIHGLDPEYLDGFLYHRTGASALAHLLRVAGGLDSMVLGEQQIMGQIKTAYDEACAAGSIGSCLHKTIQDALRVGKKVRSLTNISRGVTSISGAVVELIKKEAGLEEKRALVIGAGKIGALTVSKMADLSMKEVVVTNRDMSRLEALLTRENIRAADIRTLFEEISAADIVIAATAAPGNLLHRGMVESALKAGDKGLLLIDMGVPRNIDDNVRDIPGVRLYNIDDLAPVIDETIRARSLEAVKAEDIIQEELEALGAGPKGRTRSAKLCAGSFLV